MKATLLTFPSLPDVRLELTDEVIIRPAFVPTTYAVSVRLEETPEGRWIAHTALVRAVDVASVPKSLPMESVYLDNARLQRGD